MLNRVPSVACEVATLGLVIVVNSNQEHEIGAFLSAMAEHRRILRAAA